MEYSVVENFRDSDGNHIDPWCLCDFCRGISEVMIKVDCPVGYGVSILMDKGCLTRMIEAIDRAYMGYMKADRIVDIIHTEDDGYCD